MAENVSHARGLTGDWRTGGARLVKRACKDREMNTPGAVVHVVLTQWRSDAPSEALAEMKEIVDRFPAEIPGVVSVVDGASVSAEGLEAGYDWALVVTFESASARDGYLDHPTHLPVAAVIGQWAERLVVFDLDA